jgi:hypothetical protein
MLDPSHYLSNKRSGTKSGFALAQFAAAVGNDADLQHKEQIRICMGAIPNLAAPPQ